MSEKPVKIQINSLEALERLIGGNSEFEFEIRESIVQKFATKHLKSVATSDALSKIASALKDEITADLVKQTSSGGWNKTYALTDKAKKLLDDTTSDKIRSMIEHVVETHIRKHADLDNLKAYIDGEVKRVADRVADMVAEKKIAALVDIEIKKRLNLS